jgi:hypothetical protein
MGAKHRGDVGRARGRIVGCAIAYGTIANMMAEAEALNSIFAPTDTIGGTRKA